jgi:hypothetical protein
MRKRNGIAWIIVFFLLCEEDFGNMKVEASKNSKIEQKCTTLTILGDSFSVMPVLAFILSAIQSSQNCTPSERHGFAAAHTALIICNAIWFGYCFIPFMHYKASPRVASFLLKMVLSLGISLVAIHSLDMEGLIWGSTNLVIATGLFLVLSVWFRNYSCK